MQRISIATEHLPDADQFPYYREQLFDRIVGITAEANGATSFKAQAAGWIDPNILRFRARSDAYEAARTARDISRIGWEDWVVVFQEEGAGSVFGQAGAEIFAAKGDLVVLDPTLPFTQSSRGAHRHDVWFLPRGLLTPHLPRPTGPGFRHLTRHAGGPASLFRDYLDSLGRQIDGLSEAETGAAADVLSRLLAMACGGETGGRNEAVRAGRLAVIKRYVDHNLTRPNLSATMVAAAMNLSVRQLHRVFEPSGTSLAEYIAARRLDECRASLLSPREAGRSVTDIAFGWGFNSLPSFYRGFSRRFGCAPRDLRLLRSTRAATSPA